MFAVAVVAVDPCPSLGFETVAPDMASGPFTFSTAWRPILLLQGVTVAVPVRCAQLKLHSVATDASGPFAFGTAEFTGDAGGPPGAADVDGMSLMASVERSSLMQHSAIWPAVSPPLSNPSIAQHFPRRPAPRVDFEFQHIGFHLAKPRCHGGHA